MENLRLDDFTNYKFLSGIQHSPDGRRACFVVHQADLDSNEYRSHLWLYNLENESCLQLTGLGKERSFAWLNDDEILFSALRNPKDQERQKKGEEFTVFYKISVHGGEAVEAFRVPRTVLGIKPLPGERFLLTCVYNPKRPDLSTMSEQDKAEELKKREEEKSYEVLEEIPYWSNGRGFVSGSRSRLYLYDLGTNSLEPLTGELMQVTDLELNLKKDKAVFAASEYSGMAKLTNSLYLADLDDKSVRRITLRMNSSTTGKPTS